MKTKDIEEILSKVDLGQYLLMSKEKGTSDVWKKFKLLKEKDGAMTDFVICTDCRHVRMHKRGGSTSSLRDHVTVCRNKVQLSSGSSSLPKSSVEKPQVTKEMFDAMSDAIVDWTAVGLVPFRKVEGPFFEKVIQCAIDLGAEHGKLDASKLIAHPTTIARRMKRRADALREEMLPELVDAIKRGIASATTDGWTDPIHNNHFITLTFHYIDDKSEKWTLKSLVLYTAEYNEVNECSENLIAELKTQVASRGIDPDLLTKVHFVTDGDAKLSASLQNYSRSWCFDHCLNIILLTAFDLHLVRVDLYGNAGGAVVDSTQKAVGFILSSRTKANVSLKRKLKGGPKNRLDQKRFLSCIPMLKSVLVNFEEVQTALGKSGRADLVLQFSKENLKFLIELIAFLEKLARAHGNKFSASDREKITSKTEINKEDCTFMATVKSHIHQELATLEALELISKAKSIVAYFKRSGNNSYLDTTLKQEVCTRWNSILIMLESFFKSSEQVSKVNTILSENGKTELLLTQTEQEGMKKLIEILYEFKTESLKAEADKNPTIQFVYLAYCRLEELCTEHIDDSAMMRCVRNGLLKQLNSKYEPHSRHLMGVFFWPMFRHLNMLNTDKKAEVYSDVRSLCAQYKSAVTKDAEDPPQKKAKQSASAAYGRWRDVRANHLDEVDLYLAEVGILDEIESDDLLAWWQTKEKIYPSLSMVARLVLATPATSAYSERVFSMAGRILDKRRPGLDSDTVDSLLFLFYSLTRLSS